MPRFVRSSATAADGPAFSVPSGSCLAAGPPAVVEWPLSSSGGPPHATAAVSKTGAATASSRFPVAPLGSPVIALSGTVRPSVVVGCGVVRRSAECLPVMVPHRRCRPGVLRHALCRACVVGSRPKPTTRSSKCVAMIYAMVCAFPRTCNRSKQRVFEGAALSATFQRVPEYVRVWRDALQAPHTAGLSRSLAWCLPREPSREWSRA